MKKLINQFSDEQLMALLAFVEDHQISRAIDYLHQNTKLRLDQSKAVVIYCVEQRQLALYHYKKNPSHVPKLRSKKHIQLEEEYQFDDTFIEGLQFSPSPKSLSQPSSLFRLQTKQDNTKVFLLLWCVACMLSVILFLSLGWSSH